MSDQLDMFGCNWEFANDFKGDTSWFTKCGQLIIFSGADPKKDYLCPGCKNPINFGEVPSGD